MFPSILTRKILTPLFPTELGHLSVVVSLDFNSIWFPEEYKLAAREQSDTNLILFFSISRRLGCWVMKTRGKNKETRSVAVRKQSSVTQQLLNYISVFRYVWDAKQ